MTPRFKVFYERFIEAFGMDAIKIPATAVKFFKKDEHVPDEIWEYHPNEITLTSCQAARQSFLGDVVCLSLENIGCVAAAITFGLVDENQVTPIGDSRVYTDIMRKQSGLGEQFVPPTPRDFTDGIVYACHDSGHHDFCLFGADDCGRFKTVEIAQKAIREMTAIQPATTKAVFLFTPDFNDVAVEPDVIVLSPRPIELARIVQAYHFSTGERITGTMGAVRVVNSDLIVRPYLTHEINVSVYCVGARLIAQFGPNRMGMGMPYSKFREIVSAMEESKTGYPFHMYPGAVEITETDV